MNIKVFSSFALVAVLHASLPAQMSGTYTIDPNGSGSRNYASFSAAIYDLFQNGMGGPVTMDVAPGTYQESWAVVPIAGMSAQNKLTFKSRQMHQAVLEGGGQGGVTLTVDLSTAQQPLSGLVLDGFVFGRASQAVVVRTPTTDVEIKNCSFATLSNSQQFLASSSHKRWAIHHNRIVTTSSSGYWSLHDFEDSSFHHNSIEIVQSHAGVRFLFTGPNVRVYNNAFTGTLSTSTTAVALNLEFSAYDIEVAHNTFVIDTGTSGSCIRLGGIISRPQHIHGNILVSTNKGPAMSVSVLNPFNYDIDGNIYHAPSATNLIAVYQGSGYPSLGAWRTASGKDKNSLAGDPQLDNNLRPVASSPAIDKAVNTPSYVTDDLDGNARDTAPDIGAYEFQKPVVPFQTFGQGCPGTFNNIPVLGSTGTPKIGSTDFTVTLSNALGGANVTCIFAIGASNTKFIGGSLPFDFGGGCALLVSADLTLPLPMAGTAGPGNGTQQVKFRIPNNQALKGAAAHFQWGVVDPVAKGIGLAFSNGGTLRL